MRLTTSRRRTACLYRTATRLHRTAAPQRPAAVLPHPRGTRHPTAPPYPVAASPPDLLNACSRPPRGTTAGEHLGGTGPAPARARLTHRRPRAEIVDWLSGAPLRLPADFATPPIDALDLVSTVPERIGLLGHGKRSDAVLRVRPAHVQGGRVDAEQEGVQ